MSTTPLNVTENQETMQSDSTSESNGWVSSILSLIITGAVMFAVVFLLRAYIVKPFIVNGVSMYPTFDSWHYLLIDEATYNFYREPERGEVVVFLAPGDSGRYFIKRVIGLPGETVHINGNTVSIETPNNTERLTLIEPYIIDAKRKPEQISITLAYDEYYMLGDNRLESADSRYWGPLERDRIVGRVLLRLFPLNKIDWMPGDYEYQE